MIVHEGLGFVLISASLIEFYLSLKKLQCRTIGGHRLSMGNSWAL